MNGGTTYYPANTSIAINADITFTAGWRGGLYDIAVTPSIYGTVTAYVNNAVVTGADLADLVYLKVTPVLGYKVKTISVSYTVGTTAYPVTVTAAPSTSVYDYYFSMPSNNVTITVTYERDGMPFTDVHSWQWHYQPSTTSTRTS